jgi:protein-tyrosine-phosphatase
VRAEVTRALRAYGIAWGGHSKHLDVYCAEAFDYVVTLCDRVKEVCPDFPGRTERIHWNVPDPSDMDTPEALEETEAEVRTRVGFFAAHVRADLAVPREDRDARHR